MSGAPGCCRHCALTPRLLISSPNFWCSSRIERRASAIDGSAITFDQSLRSLSTTVLDVDAGAQMACQPSRAAAVEVADR